MFVEEQGRPAALLIYKYFLADAESAASSKGLPGIRMVPESIVSECNVPDEIEAGVDEVMDRIVDALTRPLSETEKTPTPKDTGKQERVVFKGSLEEVNRFFYRRGWTDGLPVIQPLKRLWPRCLPAPTCPKMSSSQNLSRVAAKPPWRG